MIQQILDLEKEALLLEPSSKQRKKTRKKIIKYSETFLDNIDHLPAFVISEDKGKLLLESPISENPIAVDDIIDLIKTNVDTPGLNPASGGHLGYIPGGGIYYSALGDYLADISNRYAGIFFASPGAVHMENMLIKWCADLIGYPDQSGGNLASGGSIANLTAIVTAREAHNIKARDIDRTVIYLSAHAHHCIDKAIRIAGLKECVVKHVPLNDKFQINTEELNKIILNDKKSGLKPWLIIASAGTTDVGAVDPLSEIGDIAKSHGMWFHIDAAYGGFFVMTEKGKELFNGIEKSDSVVMDPHKSLFLPYGLGIVIVKDKSKLAKAHYYQANYMQDTLSSVEEPSPADLSPELTKPFRGMRMWLPLKLLGTKPFVACLNEKLLLAEYFYDKIQKLGFEVGPKPELSVVTYRFVPKNGDADKFNAALVQHVQEDGRVFISSTLINGKFTLRLAVLSFRTHLKTIDTLLEILGKKVKEMDI